MTPKEAGYVVKRMRKSTETEYIYRKRMVADMPFAEEKSLIYFMRFEKK